MKDFLEFVNTAEPETIHTIPGLTKTLVETILSGRPYASMEELSHVKGMTEKRLTAMQEAAAKDTEESKTESKADNTVVESEVEDETTQEEPKPVRSGTAGRVIGWIIVVLLLAAAVFAAIKWGLPFINEKFIKPVESNAATITDLASQQTADVTLLNQQIATLQARVVVLETRADGVDQSLKTLDASLAELQAAQDALSDQLALQKDDLLQELSNQITLVRAVDLLSRSRLYLSESNYGLAKTDLETSRVLLYGLLDLVPADQVNGLKTVISRIDLAIGNLPAYPVVAVYDVDTAWQLLIDGLPNVPELAVTPVLLPPSDTPTPTATLEPTLETSATPTPEVTPTP